jgi:hypothetical protein
MRYGWSLNRKDWNALPASVTQSERWRRVQLAVGDKAAVPTGCGVYVVCASPPGWRFELPILTTHNLFRLLYTALYVGKSDDLRRRFTEHCKRPKSELIASRQLCESRLDFWFLSLPADQILAVEADLINCLGPVGNRVSGIRARIGRPVPA